MLPSRSPGPPLHCRNPSSSLTPSAPSLHSLGGAGTFSLRGQHTTSEQALGPQRWMASCLLLPHSPTLSTLSHLWALPLRSLPHDISFSQSLVRGQTGKRRMGVGPPCPFPSLPTGPCYRVDVKQHLFQTPVSMDDGVGARVGAGIQCPTMQQVGVGGRPAREAGGKNSGGQSTLGACSQAGPWAGLQELFWGLGESQWLQEGSLPATRPLAPPPPHRPHLREAHGCGSLPSRQRKEGRAQQAEGRGRRGRRAGAASPRPLFRAWDCFSVP